MSLSLRVPGLRDMEYRRRLLAQPETMAYNRRRMEEAVEGYDPETGCIDFSRENWRWWRQIWLYNEPDFYASLLWDEAEARFVGEACYYRDTEAGCHRVGILIEADARGRGYCAEGLKLLAAHAFRRDEVRALRCDFPEDWTIAKKGFTRAGFTRRREAEGILTMVLERPEPDDARSGETA